MKRLISILTISLALSTGLFAKQLAVKASARTVDTVINNYTRQGYTVVSITPILYYEIALPGKPVPITESFLILFDDGK